MTNDREDPLGRLDQEGRLSMPILKSPTTKAGRFDFAGHRTEVFKLKLSRGTKASPEFRIEGSQIAQEGKATSHSAGYLHPVPLIWTVAKVFGDL